MRLTGIFLYPDLGEFKSEAAFSFRNQTGFICQYVQRYLAARHVQGDGFNRICVICKSVASEATFKNTARSLSVEVPFDMAEYERTARDDLPDYFIGLLEAGLRKCSRDQHLSFEIVEEAIASFRAGGYKNQWVHSTTLFRSAGLKCRLTCKLDLSWFYLVLEVERDGQCIFSQEILRTLPDALMYTHQFKDIELNDHVLAVKNKFGTPLFELDLAVS
ncbi:hypothetical protein SRABI118_02365 [Massilia sp. Bi118]|uniref:hypothetical protein n=1 Tax=Massilia sp. Bi118 TaxID=2822346 RepID=UPI001DFE13A8|nr:hypothetical protein [Massilia sp. Bi118]CAH0226934.1 hypothetical protein SRABI118_02365 [Massilia sp. Bi118]